MSKKWLTLFIVFAMLAITVGTALAEAAPGTCPHSNTVRVGKGGFFSTNADFPCQTNATSVRVSSAPAPKTLQFVRPLMYLSKKTVQPDGVVFSGKTRAFFDLNKNQEKAWKAGVLAVYFYDMNTRTWMKLPSSQWVMKGKTFRIGSNIWDYGYYGLAKTR
jgi:hypothetical protein